MLHDHTTRLKDYFIILWIDNIIKRNTPNNSIFQSFNHFIILN